MVGAKEIEVPLEELFGTKSLHEAYYFTPTPAPHLLDACRLWVIWYFVHLFNDLQSLLVHRTKQIRTKFLVHGLKLVIDFLQPNTTLD